MTYINIFINTVTAKVSSLMGAASFDLKIYLLHTKQFTYGYPYLE